MGEGMRKTLAAAFLAAASLFMGAAPASAQNNYFALSYDTARGTAAMTLMGDFRVADSSRTPTTYIFRVNGWDGLVVSTRAVFKSSVSILNADLSLSNGQAVTGALTAKSSWTFDASGAATFSVGLSSGLDVRGGGIRFADGTYQYTAGQALLNATNTWTGGNDFRAGLGAAYVHASSVSIPGTGKIFLGSPCPDCLEISYNDSDGQAYYDNTYGGVPTSLIYGHVFRGGSSDTELARIAGMGMSIGGIAPGAKFHIAGAAADTNLVHVSSANGAAIWQLSSTGTVIHNVTGNTFSQSALEVTFTPNAGSNAAHYAIRGEIASGYVNNDAPTAIWGRSTRSGGSGAAIGIGGAAYYNGAGVHLIGGLFTANGVNGGGAGSENYGVVAYGGESGGVSERNVGVFGMAHYVGTKSNYGGYFELANIADAQTTPGVMIATIRDVANGSAALAANNNDRSAPIFLALDNGTTAFMIDDGGIVKSTAQPTARWTRDTAMTISDATNTTLTFPNKGYNTQSLFSVATATVPTNADGKYAVHCFASFATNTVGRRAVWAAKNGTVIPGCKMTFVPVTADETQLSANCYPELVAGDAITCNVFQNSLGNLDVNSAAIEVLKLW